MNKVGIRSKVKPVYTGLPLKEHGYRGQQELRHLFVEPELLLCNQFFLLILISMIIQHCTRKAHVEKQKKKKKKSEAKSNPNKNDESSIKGRPSSLQHTHNPVIELLQWCFEFNRNATDSLAPCVEAHHCSTYAISTR